MTVPREIGRIATEIVLDRRRLLSQLACRDAWIFCVVHFGADLLHCRVHPLRFRDRHNIVIGAMKDPDGRLADLAAAASE